MNSSTDVYPLSSNSSFNSPVPEDDHSSKEEADVSSREEMMMVHSEIIFDPGEQAFLAAIYGTTLILGLLSNAAMIWVILGEHVLI